MYMYVHVVYYMYMYLLLNPSPTQFYIDWFLYSNPLFTFFCLLFVVCFSFFFFFFGNLFILGVLSLSLSSLPLHSRSSLHWTTPTSLRVSEERIGVEEAGPTCLLSSMDLQILGGKTWEGYREITRQYEYSLK